MVRLDALYASNLGSSPSGKTRILIISYSNLYKFKNYQEVEERYNELGTWEKVAESFGLTRKVIQGIRKRAGKL